MKKIFLSVAIVMSSMAAMAQADSTKVVKYIDEMSNESFIYASNKLILINEANTQGFSINIEFKEEKDKIVQNGLLCKLVGMGECVENNEMIIMFADSSKITLKSWNKFNCDGNAYFNLSKDQEDQLRNKQVLKIRMMNGRSFQSLTVNAHDNQNDYFRNAIAQADKQLITIIKE